MRNVVCLFFCVFLTVTFMAAPPDVSEQLDVYKEVVSIIELGIMNVDNRGYFHGTNSVNRYELATSLYELRENIMGSKVFKEFSGISNRVMRLEQDVESNKGSLKKLRNRLSILEVSLSREELDAMEQRLLELKDEVLVEIQNLEDKTSFISGYSDFLTAVERELEDLYAQVEEQESRLSANEANVTRLVEYLRIYKDLDQWMKEMESEDVKLHASDSEIMSNVDALEKRISNLEVLQQEVESFRKQMNDAAPALNNAAKIPEIERTLGNFNSRISNLEGMGDALNKLAQDNDYLKIENDRMKKEVAGVKKQLWYAIGIGVAGAGIGAIALVYSMME